MTVARLLPFVFAVALIACKPAPQSDFARTPATTTAPAPVEVHRPVSTTTDWECGDLKVITRFDDSSLEAMTLTYPEKELALKSAATDDGVRFADAAGNAFWSRPGKVTLTLVGQAERICRKTR